MGCFIGVQQDAFRSDAGTTTEDDLQRAQIARFESEFKDALEEFDADASGDLDLDEVEAFLDQHLNINVGRRELEKKFLAFDSDNNKTFSQKEFVRFLITLQNRNEIVGVFNQFQNDMTITAKGFRHFLYTTQGEQVSENMASKIISAINRCSGRVALDLGFFEFQQYMFGGANWVLDPEHIQVCEDMTRPITDYYIAASHNTYLTGHQLYGDSSVDMYRKALLRGCRCVEIDCWDGEDKGGGALEPIVYHGHTLTTQIKFADVTQCIAKHAFQTSEYPLVVRLEMHCSKPYQQAVAAILKEHLGEWLPETTPDPEEPLQSPEQLKRRILIIGKMDATLTTEAEDDAAEEDEDTIEAFEQQREVQLEKEEQQKREWEQKQAREVQEDPEGADPAAISPEKDVLPVEQDAKPIAALDPSDLSVHPDLAALYYFKQVKPDLKQYLEDRAAGKKVHSKDLCSFREGVTAQILEEGVPDFVHFNRTQLSRVYPSGIRTDSSNYSPMIAWAMGVQIAALNYQTISSAAMALQDTMFFRNGRCGYVLKPPFLRSTSQPLPAEYHPQTYAPHRTSLVVRVISGKNLPKEAGDKIGEVVDPSVTLELHDSTGGVQSKSTAAVRKNGFNPVWDELFEFKIRHLDLSLLTFTVYDIDFLKPDYIAHSGVPCQNMRTGYRVVPLVDADGAYIPDASLLCHFEVKETFRSSLKKGPRSAHSGSD